MIKEKKTFDFLGVEVECLLTDTPPEDFSPGAEGGVYGVPVKDDPTTFRVWFKGLVKDTTFVHECWHLFFAIMKYIDTRIHTFDELYEEIYAYTFHSLYLKLVETTTHMKTYHKFWEEKEKSSKTNESRWTIDEHDEEK